MSDKPKTIQEALAEVQRKVNEERIALAKANWQNVQELAGGTTPPATGGTTPPATGGTTPSSGQKFKSAAKTLAKGASISLGAPAIGAGVGYLAGKTAEKLATGTETGRNIGKWIGDNVPGARTAANALKPTSDAITTAFGGTPPQRNAPAAAATPAASPSAPAKTEPAKTEPAKTEPAKTEPAKTETPPAGSSAAKMSFNDAYAKARQMAKAAGKDENLAQFKFDRGGGEKVYQAAATKADYVPMKQQFAVDINAPSKSKGEQGPPMPNIGPPMPKETETKPQADSGGRKKVAEENISEAPYGAPGLVGTGNMNRTGGGTITTAPRPTPRPTNLPSSSTTSAKPAKPMMGTASDFANFKQHNQGATYGQYLNTIRGLTAKKGGANDPDVIQNKMNADALKKGPVAPQKAWDPDSIKTPSSRPPVNTTPSQGSTANLNPPGRGSSDRTPAIHQDRGSDPKTSSASNYDDIGVRGGSTQSGVRSSYSDIVMRSGSPDVLTPKDRDREREVAGGNPTPTGTSEVMTSSGNPNKKSKVSEENNPLISAFLKLQEKETSNMFVEAKKLSKKQDEKLDVVDDDKIDAKDLAALRARKSHMKEELAKKDHDGDGNIESEKDEVWGSRLKAAKKAGKLKEGSADPVNPDMHPAAKDVTEKKKVKKEEVESSKMPKDWGEEVTFSESELAYFASIDEVGSVTPMAPTDAKEVSAKSDKSGKDVPQRDLTDGVVEEGRKKKEVASTEPTERDARQHVQVIAGQAAGGREIDFKHNNGKSTKIGPEMGRKITAHLNGLKPAERQAKVKAMHDSPEGMKF